MVLTPKEKLLEAMVGISKDNNYVKKKCQKICCWGQNSLGFLLLINMIHEACGEVRILRKYHVKNEICNLFRGKCNIYNLYIYFMYNLYVYQYKLYI